MAIKEPSKAAIRCQKSTEKVTAAVDTYAERIETACKELLSPHLKKGEKLPDVGLFVTLLGRALRETCDTVVAADVAHIAELENDAKPREERDSAAQAIREHLSSTKEIVTGVFGSQSLESLGLSGRVPKDGQTLARHAVQVADKMEKATLPVPRVKGVKIDVSEWSEPLRKQAKILEAALKDVAREEKEAAGTLVAKNNALAEHDQVFSYSASVLSAMLRYVGEEDLAARIRPSSRRASTVDEEDVSEEPAPEPMPHVP